MHMKRLIAILTIILFWGGSAAAQNMPEEEGATQPMQTPQPMSLPKTDWLPEFGKVAVSGPVNVTFKRVEKAEEAKIVYDTKGSTTSRFRAAVNKNGVLQLSERVDAKSTLVTEATVYYVALDEVKVDHATVTFTDPIRSTLFDLLVSGGAIVAMELDVLDAFVECTGKSALRLSGSARYLKLNVSTASIDAQSLNTVSTDVNASHGAEIYIAVEERLEAVTSTAAKLYYKGSPTILRNRNSLFGGEIAPVK